MKRHRPTWKGKHRKRSKSSDTFSEILLDRFTKDNLEEWKQNVDNVQKLNYKFFYCLHSQREAIYEKICESLKKNSSQTYRITDWHRIIGYRYTLNPLSCVGSLRWIGGRFNYGGAINDRTFPPFPCLYIDPVLPHSFSKRRHRDSFYLIVCPELDFGANVMH